MAAINSAAKRFLKQKLKIKTNETRSIYRRRTECRNNNI